MKSFAERPRLDVFKSKLVKDAYFSSVLEFPLLEKTDFKPIRAIPFDKALKSRDTDQWVHFYIHDYCFERIWNNPVQYLNSLKKFNGVITPDFSLYREMPLVMQMWNTYRNRTIGYWLQSNGVNIIPNIRWGDERTYSFAFEGIEKGATVAISTNGCIQKKVDRKYFIDDLEKMVEELEPKTIVNYSRTPNDIFSIYVEKGIEIISIENYIATVKKAAI